MRSKIETVKSLISPIQPQSDAHIGTLTPREREVLVLMAQGAGRLLRSVTDRGVVAVLDNRLATKRYGSYIRRSLPAFWDTTDPNVVRGALRRLVAKQ